MISSALAAAIPGAISGIASIMGGSAADKTNQTNAQIALMNYYQQQAALRQQAAEARRQQSDAKLGTTDAAGNRTYFMPGVGWVTELTADQQSIQNATEDEQLRQLSQGSRDERVQERSNDRRNREDVLASAAEDEFRQQRRPDENALRQLFLARGAETRNQSADRAGDAVARQNIRAGGRNAAELLQGARAASDATGARQAGIEAELLAGQEADRQFDTGRDKASQLYDYFRKMATSGTGNSPLFQTQGPQKTSTGVADQGLINSLGKSVDMPYTQANDAWASTVADIGSGLQGYFGSLQQQDFNQQMLNRFGKNTGGLA